MSDDDMPDLDDFSDQMPVKQNDSKVDVGDYTKVKEPLQSTEFTGLKKGFLNTSNEQPTKPQPKKNPLEIDEVQENMKPTQSPVGQFLQQNKDQWLNPALLQKISTNPKLQKLFTNPEYLNAVQQMQSNPKGIMEKYKNNKEFVELMSEYMLVMGQHFQTMEQPKETKVAATKPKQQTQEEKIQEIIQTDPQVKQVLSDQKVMAFIEYLQKNGQVDFHQLAYRDPQLMKQLQILIEKGVLNIQKM